MTNLAPYMIYCFVGDGLLHRNIWAGIIKSVWKRFGTQKEKKKR